MVSQIKNWPEISVFARVMDISQMLSKLLEVTQAGKKRSEIETILKNLEKNAPPLESLSGKMPSEITLNEAEQLSQNSTGPDRDILRRWWNDVKKARTYCTTIRRNENKDKILPLCRARLPESSLKWLDAVYTLKADGSASYNPLLGTGGNELRLELSNNFMQRIAELFIKGKNEETRRLFHSTVFDISQPGMIKGKIGQFDPGRAGGYNQGNEIETKDFKINPWDFILTLEGALMLSGALVRRNPTDERSNLTTPFTVFFSSVGFSSSAYSETGRRETWLPIWQNPASCAEIEYLFAEGRASIGQKLAQNGIEFSRAVGTLGVDRGVDAFERFAFLERRGKSYVALPAGRIKVRYRPELELLNELDRVIEPAIWFLQAFKTPPATFQSARQNIDEAIFACTQKPEPYSFSKLLRALGNLEKLIALRDRSKDPAMRRPLFGLSPRWIVQSDDGSVEVRLAAALASIRATGKVGPLRSNMAGTNPFKPQGMEHWKRGLFLVREQFG